MKYTREDLENNFDDIDRIEAFLAFLGYYFYDEELKIGASDALEDFDIDLLDEDCDVLSYDGEDYRLLLMNNEDSYLEPERAYAAESVIDLIPENLRIYFDSERYGYDTYESIYDLYEDVCEFDDYYIIKL